MYTKEAINHFARLLSMEHKVVMKYLETITRSFTIYSELIRNVSIIVPKEHNVEILKENLESNSFMALGHNDLLLKRISEENGIANGIVDNIDEIKNVEDYENLYLFNSLNTDIDILEETLLYAVELKNFKSLTILTSLEENSLLQISKDLNLKFNIINLENWRDDTLTVKFKKKG